MRHRRAADDRERTEGVRTRRCDTPAETGVEVRPADRVPARIERASGKPENVVVKRRVVLVKNDRPA
jgi:hypothetical protein